MTHLADTNVISEGMRQRPHPHVSAWLSNVDEDSLFISTIVLAELRLGVERLPQGQRQERLDIWIVNELSARFESRILPVDESVADMWGRIFAYRLSIGRPISIMDAFHAATARIHQMTLVTRNTKDFSDLGLPLLNPWETG